VPETFVPLNPAEAATKLDPAFDNIAVVRYAPGAWAVVKNAGIPRLSPLVPCVPAIAVPAVVVEENPVPAPPPEGAATLKLMPFEPSVPLMFVPLKLPAAAMKLLPAFEAIAVVM
jgi:hypothetical protein